MNKRYNATEFLRIMLQNKKKNFCNNNYLLISTIKLYVKPKTKQKYTIIKFKNRITNLITR